MYMILKVKNTDQDHILILVLNLYNPLVEQSLVFQQVLCEELLHSQQDLMNM